MTRHEGCAHAGVHPARRSMAGCFRNGSGHVKWPFSTILASPPEAELMSTCQILPRQRFGRIQRRLRHLATGHTQLVTIGCGRPPRVAGRVDSGAGREDLEAGFHPSAILGVTEEPELTEEPHHTLPAALTSKSAILKKQSHSQNRTLSNSQTHPRLQQPLRLPALRNSGRPTHARKRARQGPPWPIMPNIDANWAVQ